MVGGAVCAFLLTPEGGLRAVPDVAALADVSRAARLLRYQLQKAATLPRDYAGRYAAALEVEARGALGGLWELLLAPLAPHLGGMSRLTLVPHGALHGLPFHAFFDRQGGGYALDRWELLYAPSAAVWHVGAKRRRGVPGRLGDPGRALLMGVPDPGLPRIADEIRALCDVLPGARALEGTAATTEAFRAHATGSRLIHLATHALFRPENPLFSGLRFADGWLLARDLYGMRLTGCELATLSACRTGVGRVEAGDELFGLLRGFLAAGARSVAASLWPVDDEATARLMARFYSRLGEAGGDDKAAALCAAAREAREERPHPYYWAPFVLVGER